MQNIYLLPLHFNILQEIFMNLILDIGNTNTKIALFKSDILLQKDSFFSISLSKIVTFLENNAQINEIKSCIVSTVKDYPEEIDIFLQKNFQFIKLNADTPVPISNKYHSPKTLGKDRLAAAVAACKIFPNTNILIMDAGTSLTYEFVNKEEEYLGGAISPGIKMRFDALHHFTGKLPLLYRNEPIELIGKNTEESIFSGVLNGILGEVKATIKAYQNNYFDLKIIFTGGDHKYFVDKLKIYTFAEPNLVLIGLQKILQHNTDYHSH